MNKGIKLDENFFVTEESKTLTLRYRRIVGRNEETGKDIISAEEWYFPNWKTLLTYYSHLVLNMSKNLKEIQENIKKLESKIEMLYENKY